MNILLTSAGRRGYLVKYFKEALGNGGTVHTGNSSPISAAFAYSDHHVVTPLIYDKNYIPFLKKYCIENNISVIVPLFDVDLYVLSCHKKEFEQLGIHMIVSDTAVINICNDKWNTYKFCAENGFNTPKTFMNINDALLLLDSGKMQYPVIIKPRWGMGSIGVFQADNTNELRILYQKTLTAIKNSYLKYESNADHENCVLIQEKIYGQEYGLDVINDLNGNYQNTVCKLKYAMRSGETDCALTVDNKVLKSLGESISNKLKHISNLDVDVFIDKNDTPFVLEFNARFGGGYPFTHMAGVDLPKTLLNWINNCNEVYLKEKYGVLSQKDISIIDISKFKEG